MRRDCGRDGGLGRSCRRRGALMRKPPGDQLAGHAARQHDAEVLQELRMVEPGGERGVPHLCGPRSGHGGRELQRHEQRHEAHAQPRLAARQPPEERPGHDDIGKNQDDDVRAVQVHVDPQCPVEEEQEQQRRDAAAVEQRVEPLAPVPQADEHGEEGPPDDQRQQRDRHGALQRLMKRPEVRVPQHDSEEGQQQAPPEDRPGDLHGRCAPVKAPSDREGEGSPHREEEEREDQIDPRDARDRGVEGERRGRQLGMKKPRGQIGIARDVSGEDHPHDGQTPQQVHGQGSLFHSESSFRVRKSIFCHLPQI